MKRKFKSERVKAQSVNQGFKKCLAQEKGFKAKHGIRRKETLLDGVWQHQGTVDE